MLILLSSGKQFYLNSAQIIRNHLTMLSWQPVSDKHTRSVLAEGIRFSYPTKKVFTVVVFYMSAIAADNVCSNYLNSLK